MEYFSPIRCVDKGMLPCWTLFKIVSVNAWVDCYSYQHCVVKYSGLLGYYPLWVYNINHVHVIHGFTKYLISFVFTYRCYVERDHRTGPGNQRYLELLYCSFLYHFWRISQRRLHRRHSTVRHIYRIGKSYSYYLS